MKRGHFEMSGFRVSPCILLLACVFCLWLSPEVRAAQLQELLVSAAISLKDAFSEIGKIFEARYPAKVLFNFGATGTLARQIEGGAPVDVFASAEEREMDVLEGKGLLVTKTRTDFAGNTVVLIVPFGGEPVRGFEGLKAPSVKKIAVGNPKTVPAGRYAAEALDFYGLTNPIRNKLVLAENVRQALDYVARGEVDAGIVYATDAALRRREVTTVATAGDGSHRPIVYPIAIVKDTKNRVDADSFVKLVLSPKGQSILRKYGFKGAR